MIDLLRAKLSCLPMGARLYGGGGGGDNGYSDRQAAMKADQDVAIRNVNDIFGKGLGAGSDANLAGRESLYGTITSDAEARMLDQLGRDRTKATRGVDFQLARQGLAGGSAGIDQGRELLQHYDEGALKAHDSALAAGNDARSADEKTRLGLIGNIRSGMEKSDALSAAYAGMQNNAATARDNALSTNIGGFFDDMSLINNAARYRVGQQAAISAYPTPGGYGSATTGGFGGRITKGP